MICYCKMNSFPLALIFLVSLSHLVRFSYQLLESRRSINTEIQNKIDYFIENIFLPYNGVGGLGLAIVQNNGKLLYTTGYGYADREKGIQNGNRTQFLLGSVTKSFTAVVVLKTLHENFPELNEAVLDTPIRQLIPQANFTMSDSFRSEHATFRDLLSHKMCIQRDDFQMMSEPFTTIAEIVQQRYAKESCGFRSQFMYNNHMVLLAAELIRYLNNRTFKQNAESLLIDIGMLESTFIDDSVDDSYKTQYRAKPYYVFHNESFPMNPELMKRLSNLPAIGGLYVTPNDIARFIRFQLNKGAIDGRQVIPQQVMSWLTEPSNLFPKFNFKTKNDPTDIIVESPLAYGLGIMIGSYDGWEKISHNGYFTPYRSEVSWYPSLKMGIFTSTHEAPSHVKQQVLHGFIFETLLGKENASQRAVNLMNVQRAKGEDEQKRKVTALEAFLGHCKNVEDSTDEDIWYNLLGIYKNSVSGAVKISQKYSLRTRRIGLYMSYGKWGKGWLENIGGNAYRIVWDTDLVQDYYAAGDVDGLGYLIIQRDDGVLNFVRPTPHGMISYAKFKKEEIDDDIYEDLNK